MSSSETVPPPAVAPPPRVAPPPTVASSYPPQVRTGSRFQSLVQPDATTKRKGNFESRFTPLSHHHHSGAPPPAQHQPINLPPPPKLQYSRDELLQLAVPTTEYTDLITEPDSLPEGALSEAWLGPELFKPFESEEVFNAWYDSLNPTTSSTQQHPQQERHRGAGKPFHHESTAGGPPKVNDWRKSPPASSSSFLPSSGGMDLEKLSLMSNQFQKDMDLELAGGLGGGGFFSSSSSQVMRPNATGLGSIIPSSSTPPVVSSVLDAPLEEGLVCPPAEEVLFDTKTLTFGLDPWDSLDLLNSQSVFGQNLLAPTSSSSSSSSVLRSGGGLLPPARANSIPTSQLFAPPSTALPPPPQQQQQTALTMDEWYYMDPQQAIQGPFTSKEMREWYEAGYFHQDLPICPALPGGGGLGNSSTRKFFALTYVFPQANGTPFATQPPQYIVQQLLQQQPQPPLQPVFPSGFGQLFGAPDLQQIQQHMAAAEQMERQQQQLERQQKQLERQQLIERQQQRDALEEQQRLLQQQQAEEQQHQQMMEEQARLLLAEASLWTVPPEQPKVETAASAAAAAPMTKKQAKKAAAAAALAAPEPPATVEQQQPVIAVAAPPPPPAPPVPAWGKASMEPIRAPTLKEIQEAEEEKRKQQPQPDLNKPMSMASHVARAAGIIETSSSHSPIVVVSKPTTAAAVPAAKPAAAVSFAKPLTAATTTTAPAAPAEQAKEMSPEFQAWCEENLPSNCTLTLLEICFGMEHTEDMRDILHSSLLPDTFVNEFIKRAAADKVGKTVLDTSSEWISTGKSPRKAAKKKQQRM